MKEKKPLVPVKKQTQQEKPYQHMVDAVQSKHTNFNRTLRGVRR